jgi:hypothetical protein
MAATELAQIAADLAHWRAAARSLTDLETAAAPGAWAALERYLGAEVRRRLSKIAESVANEADRLAAAVAGATLADTHRLRVRVLDLRHRYVQAETIIDFYAEAVNHRTTPRVASLMRGLDGLAVDSMQVVLRQFGIDAPPALTYLDKGLGASILRAGVRLWDGGTLSPAAAIKITRHNLLRPTSLIHETGHQVAHLLGWNAELASALAQTLSSVSSDAADAWRSWASEVAADVHAFALLGYSPVPALATVVDGSSDQVFAMPFGDPHPFAWIRVLFNVELCRSWYGAGPWDELASAWIERHSLHLASADVQHVIEATLPRLRQLADVCTRRPMRAFRGRPLYQLVDPMRVSPTALTELAARAGDSLYTSSYLQRQESIRILAWNTLQVATAPERSPALSRQLEEWLIRGGSDVQAAAA